MYFLFPSKKRILASFWIFLWGFSFAQVLEIQASGTGATEEEAILEAKKNLAMRIAMKSPYESLLYTMTRQNKNELFATLPEILPLSENEFQATYRISSANLETYTETLDKLVQEINKASNFHTSEKLAILLEVTEGQLEAYDNYIQYVNAVISLNGKYSAKPAISYTVLQLRLEALTKLKNIFAADDTIAPFSEISKIEKITARYLEGIQELGKIQGKTTNSAQTKDSKSISETSTEAVSEREQELISQNRMLETEIQAIAKKMSGETFSVNTNSDFLHLNTKANGDGTHNYQVTFMVNDKVLILAEDSTNSEISNEMFASTSFKVIPEHFLSGSFTIMPVSYSITNPINNRTVITKNLTANPGYMVYTTTTTNQSIYTDNIIYLAQNGDLQAQYLLVDMYRNKKNFTEALRWLEPLRKKKFRDSEDIYDSILEEILREHMAKEERATAAKFLPKTENDEKKFPINFGLGISGDFLACTAGEELSNDFFAANNTNEMLYGRSFEENKFSPRVGLFLMAEYELQFFRKNMGVYAVGIYPEVVWAMKMLKDGEITNKGDGFYYNMSYSYNTLVLTIPFRFVFAGFYLGAGPVLNFSVGEFNYTLTEWTIHNGNRNPVNELSNSAQFADFSMRLNLEFGYQLEVEHFFFSIGLKAMPMIAENLIKRSLILKGEKIDFFQKEPSWLLGGTMKIGFKL